MEELKKDIFHKVKGGERQRVKEDEEIIRHMTVN